MMGSEKAIEGSRKKATSGNPNALSSLKSRQKRIRKEEARLPLRKVSGEEREVEENR